MDNEHDPQVLQERIELLNLFLHDYTEARAFALTDQGRAAWDRLIADLQARILFLERELTNVLKVKRNHDTTI